jgi:hypothetical protein
MIYHEVYSLKRFHSKSEIQIYPSCHVSRWAKMGNKWLTSKAKLKGGSNLRASVEKIDMKYNM